MTERQAQIIRKLRIEIKILKKKDWEYSYLVKKLRNGFSREKLEKRKDIKVYKPEESDIY